jgi:uncharacterized membrane protein YfcA
MAGLGGFVAEFGWMTLLAAAFGFLAGGFIKGVVGFALPMVALSINGSFLPYEIAVALLIVPTLVSNTFQSLRNGAVAAWESLVEFWRLNLVLVLTIGFSAQLVVRLPEAVLFGALGVFITVFGVSQLGGWKLHFSNRNRGWIESLVALVGRFFGGLSGIWGPPVVMYLLASGVPKVAMVRAQSLSFVLGSIVLIGAHLRSGVLNAQTLPVSAWLVLPTMAAMFAGYVVQDRLDQDRFRRLTLAVLIIAGMNLLRRAFFT